MSANSYCSSAVKGKWELRWGHNSCKEGAMERARIEEGGDFRFRYETTSARIGITQDVSRIHVGCVSPVDARYASPFARKSAETGQIS
jgi:hypothetical protein